MPLFFNIWKQNNRWNLHRERERRIACICCCGGGGGVIGVAAGSFLAIYLVQTCTSHVAVYSDGALHHGIDFLKIKCWIYVLFAILYVPLLLMLLERCRFRSFSSLFVSHRFSVFGLMFVPFIRSIWPLLFHFNYVELVIIHWACARLFFISIVQHRLVTENSFIIHRRIREIVVIRCIVLVWMVKLLTPEEIKLR